MILSRLRVLRAIARGAIEPRTKVSRLPHVVRWADCDLNLHMTNGRYLSVMDAGRWHLVVCAGAWSEMLRRGLRPAVVETRIAFKKELKPGQRFILDTRLVRLEGKAMHFEQHFLVGDRVHARAELTALVLKDGKVVEPEDVWELLLAEPLR